MNNTYIKPSSDSGESDSEQNLEQDKIVSNNKKTFKTTKFYKRQDSDSDSDSDCESDPDSNSETNEAIKASCTSPSDEFINSEANDSKSVLNKLGLDADLDAGLEEDLDTKSNTKSEINKSGTNKTRKALKNAIRIQQQKIKMEEKKRLKENNSKNDDNHNDDVRYDDNDNYEEKFSSFALDSLQHHNHMMSESIFSKIHIRCVQRNSRKSTTTIEGISNSFFEDKNKINNILKALRCGTRATHKFDKETNTNILELSGNKIQNIINVICEHVECEKSQIVVHGVLS